MEVLQLHYKMDWLDRQMSLVESPTMKIITQYKCKTNPKNSSVEPLREFDDIACQYHAKVKLVIGTIRNDCSRMTTEMDIKVLKLGLKQDMDKETFGDQFMGCTIEFGIEEDLSKVEGAPVKLEAKVAAGVEFEFDRKGLKDVTLKGEIKAELGTNVIDMASKESGIVVEGGGKDLIEDSGLSMGTEVKVSLISGKTSVEGTGILKGVKY
jgi:hypothetical protein